jgi:hypothetical protein
MAKTTVQPLVESVIKTIVYEQIELSKVSLLEDGDKLNAVLPAGKKLEMTKDGISTMCEILEVPKKFALKLWEDGRGNVLSYIQEQLSASIREPVYVVYRDKTLFSFAAKENLLLFSQAVLDFDKKLLENDKITVRYREIRGETLSYFVYDEERSVSADDNIVWQVGYLIEVPLYGIAKFRISIQAVRSKDLGRLIIDTPDYDTPTLKDKIENVQTNGFNGSLASYWDYLSGYIKKLKAATASMQEVKNVKDKLVRSLKVDKSDTETKDRIETELKWKELYKAYNIKDMIPKPTKLWYAKASTTLTLWTICSFLVKEAAIAPLDVDEKKIKALFLLSRKILEKIPDTSETPPQLDPADVK